MVAGKIMANFIKGLRVFKPNEKAPDFVKANLVINCKELVEYMRANHTDGQMRVDIKLGKTGNLYAELNTWKKPEHPFGKDKTYQETFNVPTASKDFVDYPMPPVPEDDIYVKDIPF